MTPERIGGRYEIEDRLGHGGMATVYLARDRELGRPVALKILADNLAGDDSLRKRFKREARLAAKLDHPNVVQVYDVGEEGDRPYIVMEHVDGGTLADRLDRRGELSVEAAIPVLQQMCDGLAHAHQRRLVHRDVKPANLLLREGDGTLKIADFGIARAAEETRLTEVGRVIGTDRYMAPEQLADGRITPATDVYACGVVADQTLPGDRAPELEAIVERCLADDPRDRFKDGQALGDAFATADETGATTAPLAKGTTLRPAETRPTASLPRTRTRTRAGGATVSPRETWRRLPGAAAIGALLIAVLLVVGIVAALDSGGSDESTARGGEGQGGAAAPAPALSDPAEQARAFADYLREQSR